MTIPAIWLFLVGVVTGYLLRALRPWGRWRDRVWVRVILSDEAPTGWSALWLAAFLVTFPIYSWRAFWPTSEARQRDRAPEFDPEWAEKRHAGGPG